MGLVIGTFVILFGGGGAAIYLAILTGLFGLNAATASSTSLVTALPSLIIGAISYYHQRQINTKVGNQMLLTAIPAVIIRALVSKYIPAKIYKWLIGIVLVVLGINMLFKKKHKPQKQLRKRSLPEWKLEFMVFWAA
ncbi:sulfite exporter TauE/SafE family protein [Lactobacillus sp. R2/2]|nr:sulfite exporter TauE/SafE family protein [Lactobacillus sp. R2/2]